MFNSYKNRWDNYLNKEEVPLYLNDKYEEINIINSEKSNFYLLKNHKHILIIKYSKEELYSSLKIIEKKSLKSYVLMNEKLIFLIKELENKIIIKQKEKKSIFNFFIKNKIEDSSFISLIHSLN